MPFFFSPNSHDDTLYPPDPGTVGRRWGLDTTVLTKTPIALYLGGNPVLFGVSTGARPEGAECEAHFGGQSQDYRVPSLFQAFPKLPDAVQSSFSAERKDFCLPTF